MAAWVGRKRRGTTGVPWWKPISAAGNGSSVMRCARKPTSVKQPKWHLLSTSSTACWPWDARATSASYETTRTRDHCVHRLIHATRSFEFIDPALVAEFNQGQLLGVEPRADPAHLYPVAHRLLDIAHDDPDLPH